MDALERLNREASFRSFVGSLEHRGIRHEEAVEQIVQKHIEVLESSGGPVTRDERKLYERIGKDNHFLHIEKDSLQRFLGEKGLLQEYVQWSEADAKRMFGNGSLHG